jgi:hypothetical protein
LVILNEIVRPESISLDALQKYVGNYGNLLIIPPSEKPDKVQAILNGLHFPMQAVLDTNRVFLNKIHFSHPLFKKVFLKKTTNFAYPYIKKHLQFNTQYNWLYQLSDQTDFAQIIKRKGNIIVLNSGLSIQNTNFVEAPYLVVPLFYQAGKMQRPLDNLYYVNGQKNTYFVDVNLLKDAVLRLQNKNEEIIPMQVNQFNNVQVTTTDLPDKAGIYKLMNNKEKVTAVAYNYDRKENISKFLTIPIATNIHQIETFEQFATSQQAFFKEQSTWKRFILLALLFLLIEMLLIRFWK